MITSTHILRIFRPVSACLAALLFLALSLSTAFAVSLGDIQGAWIPDVKKNWEYNEEEVPADFDLRLRVTQDRMEWLDESGKRIAVRPFTVRAASSKSITLAFAAETTVLCPTTGETFLVRLELRGVEKMELTLLLENGMAGFTLFYTRASAATE